MASIDYLDILTNQLIELGLKIFNYRKQFIDDISDYISNNYAKITGNSSLRLNYRSDYYDKNKDELLQLYKKEQERDIVLGKTNIGIHHDDYEFILDGYNLKDYGSDGEQKNAVISLKMAEIDIFRNQKGVIPILILDDLFSELDEVKIKNILSFIDNSIQTFVTTTELNKVSDELKSSSKIFSVINGVVEEVSYEKWLQW